MAEHGTVARYGHGKCRCDTCKAANTERAANRLAFNILNHVQPRVHGTHTAYSRYGCRCTVCSEFSRAYRQQLYLKRKVAK